MARKAGRPIYRYIKRQQSAMRGAVIVLASVLLMLVIAALGFGTAANAAKGINFANSTATAGVPQRQIPPTLTKTPTGNPTHSPDGNFNGWERLTLRDLAEVEGWPTAVVYDSSGRLRVQDTPTPGEWTSAHVRAFDYVAGSRAGFAAEQEDSRMSGYVVTPELFFSYPAYRAVLTDRTGSVVEIHFRWLAATSILGVDRHAPAGTIGRISTRLISEQMLSIAAWRGLPAPPGGTVPTPNPTWSLLPDASPTTTPCSADFSDVLPNYWAYHFIYPLACSGVVSGYVDGTFRPENSTTRAQLAKMVVLGNGWSLPNPQNPAFSDIPRSHPFYRYIEAAYSHGIISGYADSTFRPDNFVTRAQVAKMIVRASGWETNTAATTPLRDVAEDSWAFPYIQAALQHGIFSGYDDGFFRPLMPATRAQLSKVLMLSISR